ncbi:hypothetical protein ACR6C2_08080 [Streptomyces sp. INA 01156]
MERRPGRGIVHAIEPTEAAPEQTRPDQAPPVEPPTEEPPAPEPPAEEPPAEEPSAAEAEQLVDEPAPPAEDPREVRLQRQQAKALGWSAGQAELTTAAAAGWLYRFSDGTLRRQDLPGAPSRIVADHRLKPLVQAGFLVTGEPDDFQRRPIRVTADGRRAVMVWKRWRPKPVERNREEECEKLRPLLHGAQERRLAEQAAEDEAKRKATSKEFREVHARLMAWEDSQDRMWAAWAKVHDVHYRLQRRPGGFRPRKRSSGTTWTRTWSPSCGRTRPARSRSRYCRTSGSGRWRSCRRWRQTRRRRSSLACSPPPDRHTCRSLDQINRHFEVNRVGLVNEEDVTNHHQPPRRAPCRTRSSASSPPSPESASRARSRPAKPSPARRATRLRPSPPTPSARP